MDKSLPLDSGSTPCHLPVGYCTEVVSSLLSRLMAAIDVAAMLPKSKKRKSMTDAAENLSDKGEKAIKSFFTQIDNNFQCKKANRHYHKVLKPIAESFSSLMAEISCRKMPKHSNEFLHDDTCQRILRVLQSQPLEHLNNSTVTCTLLVLLLLCFHCNLSIEDTNGSLFNLFGALFSCLKGKNGVPFAELIDMSLVVKHLMAVCPKFIENESNSQLLQKLFELSMQAFLNGSKDVETLIPECAKYMVSSAKSDEVTEGKKYLPVAWTVVYECYNYSNELHKSPSLMGLKKSCHNAISTIWQWSMKVLSRTDIDKCSNIDEYVPILKIYIAFLSVELEICSNVSTSKDQTPKWKKYINGGIQLAKKCFSSYSKEVISSGLSFIITLKVLQLEIPDDVIKASLETFVQISISEVGSQMIDPVTSKPLTMDNLFKDIALENYENLFSSLIYFDLSKCDVIHTTSLLKNMMAAAVPHSHERAKRISLSLLLHRVVCFLTKSRPAGKDKDGAYSCDTAVVLLDMLSAVICSHSKLNSEAVLQCFHATCLPTSHLSNHDFARVWQQQVTLLQNCLVRRRMVISEFMSGEMNSIVSLVEALVLRSSQTSSDEDAAPLLECTPYIDQLVRNLRIVSSSLRRIAPFVAARVVCALRENTVHPPIKVSYQSRSSVLRKHFILSYVTGLALSIRDSLILKLLISRSLLIIISSYTHFKITH